MRGVIRRNGRGSEGGRLKTKGEREGGREEGRRAEGKDKDRENEGSEHSMVKLAVRVSLSILHSFSVHLVCGSFFNRLLPRPREVMAGPEGG